MYLVVAFLRDGGIAYEADQRRTRNTFASCLTRSRRFACRMSEEEAERLVSHRHRQADDPSYRDTELVRTVSYYTVVKA